LGKIKDCFPALVWIRNIRMLKVEKGVKGEEHVQKVSIVVFL